MTDYLEESVLITSDETHRGLVAIRSFFTELLEGSTKGFLDAIKLTRMEVSGEVAFIVWEALPWFSFATDTLLVRDGKIVFQTFAAPKRNI
ncbi:MAG: nuclear transport factor 2 family protein [Burkholderiaceae bacterium]